MAQAAPSATKIRIRQPKPPPGQASRRPAGRGKTRRPARPRPAWLRRSPLIPRDPGRQIIELIADRVACLGTLARAIVGSRYPGLRAAEALGLILPLFLLLFASTYFVMERASAASITQPLTRTDALSSR